MNQDLDTKQVRSELQKSRQELASLIGLRDEAHVEPDADEMDQVKSAEAREFTLRSVERYAGRLRQVEDAIQRLDSGDYGVCLECDEQISTKRLRAVPWAQRCLKCQECFDRRVLGDDGMVGQFRKNAA